MSMYRAGPAECEVTSGDEQPRQRSESILLDEKPRDVTHEDVDIFSCTADAWVRAKVVDVSKENISVVYEVGSHWYRKCLPLTSKRLGMSTKAYMSIMSRYETRKSPTLETIVAAARATTKISTAELAALLHGLDTAQGGDFSAELCRNAAEVIMAGAASGLVTKADCYISVQNCHKMRFSEIIVLERELREHTCPILKTFSDPGAWSSSMIRACLAFFAAMCWAYRTSGRSKKMSWSSGCRSAASRELLRVANDVPNPMSMYDKPMYNGLRDGSIADSMRLPLEQLPWME